MRIAVLRPEPGNAETCARLVALGHRPVALPLFEIAPLPWAVPPGDFDGLLLTSANAPRHAGPALTALAALPVLAVGAATARAARAAGLNVVRTGSGDAEALLAEPHGFARLLHLGGAATTIRAEGAVRASIPVYTNRPVDVPLDAIRDLAGAIVLLHAASAGRRLADLADAAALDRARVTLRAISAPAAAAAGPGWGGVRIAEAPNEAALLACD